MKSQEVYGRIRRHCLAKDGVTEEYPWGDVVWKVRGKIFAGAEDGGNHVTVCSDPAEQARLVEHPAIEVAKYVGRFGWVTVTVRDAKTLSLALELIDRSHARVAQGKRASRPAAVAPARKRRSTSATASRARRSR